MPPTFARAVGLAARLAFVEVSGDVLDDGGHEAQPSSLQPRETVVARTWRELGVAVRGRECFELDVASGVLHGVST
jgi:hypothetical protein